MRKCSISSSNFCQWQRSRWRWRGRRRYWRWRNNLNAKWKNQLISKFTNKINIQKEEQHIDWPVLQMAREQKQLYYFLYLCLCLCLCLYCALLREGSHLPSQISREIGVTCKYWNWFKCGCKWRCRYRWRWRWRWRCNRGLSSWV